MGALRTRDLGAALTFVGELNEAESTEPFTAELLDRLLELVPCEFATYQAHDLSTGVVSSYVPCSAEGETSDTDVPRQISAEVLALMQSSPLQAHRRRTGRLEGVMTWSEIMGRGRRVRYEYMESVQRTWGIVDKACLNLQDSDVRQIRLGLESTGRDFSERDRDLLALLVPHVRARIRNVRLRRRVDALVAALEAADDQGVVIERDGEIELATPAAGELLERYFGAVNGTLPPEIATSTPVSRNGTRLVVERLDDNGTFFLREEPNVSLTRREQDVLRCVAAGKTTAETARLLWVTEATVSKHLEHVYRKLGVTSRTAALAKLNGSLD